MSTLAAESKQAVSRRVSVITDRQFHALCRYSAGRFFGFYRTKALSIGKSQNRNSSQLGYCVGDGQSTGRYSAATPDIAGFLGIHPLPW